MTDAPAKLPTHIQLIMYRIAGGQCEYLLLERQDDEADFWQPATEAVHDGDVPETVRWTAIHQLGLHHVRRLSDKTYSYEWYAKGLSGFDIVLAAEIEPDSSLTIDTNKYRGYGWFSATEAMRKIKWSGSKEAIRQLDDYMQTNGLREAAAREAAAQALQASTEPAQQNNEPSYANGYMEFGRRRLPDRPQDSHERLGPPKEVNPGEWFL